MRDSYPTTGSSCGYWRWPEHVDARRGRKGGQMILVEGTFWPLVVVGAIPDSSATAEPTMTIDECRLWSRADLRLAVVIAGDRSHACVAQDEVFAWLRRHRQRLRQCVSRVAWIFEDELMRRNA